MLAAENASAIAAAMVWVLRDGFGMIGSLLFSYAASSHMDSNIKEWRLFADIANDIGLTLDLVAPVFRGNFALVSSLATMCKARGNRSYGRGGFGVFRDGERARKGHVLLNMVTSMSECVFCFAPGAF